MAGQPGPLAATGTSHRPTMAAVLRTTTRCTNRPEDWLVSSLSCRTFASSSASRTSAAGNALYSRSSVERMSLPTVTRQVGEFRLGEGDGGVTPPCLLEQP